MTQVTRLAALVLAACSLAAYAPAQLDPFSAPTDAMDTLNSAPVGSAGGSFDPVGRARGAVAAANAGPGAAADPFGAPADPNANPFGGPPAGFQPGGGGNPFGGPAAFPGGGNPFGGPGGGFAPPPIRAPKVTNTALAGERVLDARTGEILQDAREIRILPEFTGAAGGRYSDDGQTFNDAVANDNIFTNITISRDYISPESQVVKTKLVQTLDYMSRLDPMSFFQVPVATTEPLSPLPKMVRLEADMDETLSKWLDQFLSQYQRKTEQGEAFIPTFLPPPPRAPEVPLPANFSPRNPPEDATAQGGAVGGGGSKEFGGSDVTGEPIGNASSRYF